MTAVAVPQSAVRATSAGVVIALVTSALSLLLSLSVPGPGAVAPAASETHAYDYGQHRYDLESVSAGNAASASIGAHDDHPNPVGDLRADSGSVPASRVGTSLLRNPGHQNKINAISPSRPFYDDAVSYGEA